MRVSAWVCVRVCVRQWQRQREIIQNLSFPLSRHKERKTLGIAIVAETAFLRPVDSRWGHKTVLTIGTWAEGMWVTCGTRSLRAGISSCLSSSSGGWCTRAAGARERTRSHVLKMVDKEHGCWIDTWRKVTRDTYFRLYMSEKQNKTYSWFLVVHSSADLVKELALPKVIHTDFPIETHAKFAPQKRVGSPRWVPFLASSRWCVQGSVVQASPCLPPPPFTVPITWQARQGARHCSRFTESKTEAHMGEMTCPPSFHWAGKQQPQICANFKGLTRASGISVCFLEATLLEKVELALWAGPDFMLWLGDGAGMASLSTGPGAAIRGTAGCLWEEIAETFQSQTSAFTPAAKCKMILNCQHLSPGLKNLKPYLCLSVIRSAVRPGGRHTQSRVPGGDTLFPGFGNRGRAPSLVLNLSFLV